jgi:hypothetical protein
VSTKMMECAILLQHHWLKPLILNISVSNFVTIGFGHFRLELSPKTLPWAMSVLLGDTFYVCYVHETVSLSSPMISYKVTFSHRHPAGAENFSLHHRVKTGSGTHPASYSIGTRVSFPGVRRPGRESDHSPPSSAEVRNEWNYTSPPPPTSFHGVMLS